MNYLKAILTKLNLDKMTKLKAESLKTDEEILDYLTKYISKETIVKVFEKHYGQQYIDLEALEITKEVMESFDINSLEFAGILPYEFDGLTKTYSFALNNFANSEMRNRITLQTRQNGSNASFKFAFEREIKAAFDRVRSLEKGTVKAKTEIKKVASTTSTPNISSSNNPVVLTGEFDAPVFVSRLMDKALDVGASDIHFERLEKGIQVRYRVDGVMTEKEVFNLGESEISSIYVRIKGISSMDISEKRKPQDGRVDNYEYHNRFYDLRVSTVTTILGEKVVMRIFDKTSKILTFDQLGFGAEETEKVVSMLHSQNGIILMAGATGSGKTTTLYTMIDEINSDEINIYTIEDPVEKTVENINQIQIDPRAGIDYPSTLKALLRQDPDVIVVGEIRDAETAGLSIRASLTGHLVLSTVHANGALDAISRLLDMGMEAYLLGASSQGFLSQRLVRRLCPHCMKKMTEFKSHERIWLKKLTEDNKLPMPKPSDFHEPVGCPKCVKGYKGRVAIVEVIKVTESIRNLLSIGESMNIIREKAEEEGFIAMEINALKKAMNGVTSVDELVRKLS